MESVRTLYPWTTATIETTQSSCRPFEAIMISFTQQSLPLLCFCRVCVVSSSTRNWLTGQIHSKHHPLNSTCGGVAGQGLASPSACLRGGSIRSLNPSFSRGSLVMSWLEKKKCKRQRGNYSALTKNENSCFKVERRPPDTRSMTSVGCILDEVSYWSMRHSRYSLDCSRHLELSKLLSLRHFINTSLKALHSPGIITTYIQHGGPAT